MVDLGGNAYYQRGHSALYRGFKLATSTFVLSTLDVYLHSNNALYRGLKLATSTFMLSTLDVYLHSHIPQALRFYHKICSF